MRVSTGAFCLRTKDGHYPKTTEALAPAVNSIDHQHQHHRSNNKNKSDELTVALLISHQRQLQQQQVQATKTQQQNPFAIHTPKLKDQQQNGQVEKRQKGQQKPTKKDE